MEASAVLLAVARVVDSHPTHRVTARATHLATAHATHLATAHATHLAIALATHLPHRVVVIARCPTQVIRTVQVVVAVATFHRTPVVDVPHLAIRTVVQLATTVADLAAAEATLLVPAALASYVEDAAS